MWHILRNMVTVVMLVAAAAFISHKDLANLYATRAANDLKLTDRQTVEVRAVLDSPVDKMRELTADSSSDFRSKMIERRLLESETEEAIAAALDQEQRASLDSLRWRLLPNPKVVKLKDQLNLTDLQVDQVEEILQANHHQSSRHPGSHASKPHHQSPRIRQNKAKADSLIEQVLTDDQKRLYAEMKKECRGQRTVRSESGRDGDQSRVEPK